MSLDSDPNITAKADFRIQLIDGQIVVVDGDGKKGGNVSRKQDKKLVWVNETGGTCTLTFYRMLPAEEPGPDPLAWPFGEPPAPAGCAVTLPTGGNPSSNRFEGRLSRVAEAECYKYTIDVVKNGVAYHLDPMIIVRPVYN